MCGREGDFGGNACLPRSGLLCKSLASKRNESESDNKHPETRPNYHDHSSLLLIYVYLGKDL